MACSRSITNDEIKHRILNVYTKFVSDVEPVRLSDYLVERGVISIEQWERISRKNLTPLDKCRALLNHLFSTQHPEAFLIVRKALSERDHYLLQYIDSQESECGFSVQPEGENSSQDKTKLQQLEKDYEEEKRTWEAEKDSLLKMQKQLERKLYFDKKKIEQMVKDNEEQNRSWEEEKDRLLKMQKDLETKLSLDKKKLEQLEKDNEDQKKAWKEEKNRLLKIQKDLETKLSLEEDAVDSKKICEQSLLAEQSNEIDLLRKENMELKQELEATKTDRLRYKSDPVFVETIRTMKKGKIAMHGLTILEKELFVVIEESSEVEVYDSIKFRFNRRWNLKELIDPVDIESCNRNKCLYIFDYKGKSQSTAILRVDPNGKLIKKWSTGHDYGRLSVTSESNIILALYLKSKLNEYSPDGQLIREINLSSDAGICNPWHAVKLANGHFVVSHGYGDDEFHRVCVVDAAGKLKKSFGGKCGSNIGQMNEPIYLSVDGNGFVLVADLMNSRILLLDSDLEFKREIISKEKHRLRNPTSILLDESNGRLFVADNARDSEKEIYTEGQILIFNFK